MPIKNAFDVPVQVFDRHSRAACETCEGPQRQHPHADSAHSGWLPGAAILEAKRVQFVPMVMTIAQDKANFKRQFTKKKRSLIVISDIGWGHLSSQRNPNGSDRRNQMQFPARDESMPA